MDDAEHKTEAGDIDTWSEHQCLLMEKGIYFLHLYKLKGVDVTRKLDTFWFWPWNNKKSWVTEDLV